MRTTRLLDVLASGGTGLSELRFAYDHAEDKPGKLAEVVDTAGLIKRYSYDELGRLTATRSALGITTAFAYDAAGLLASETDAAGSADTSSIGLAYDAAGHATGITAGNGVKTLRRYDDFGRKVMEADPDHGITIFRHDPAGHVVARIDESLVTTRFTYDHAERLLAMGADKKPDLVQYRYRGRQLQSVVSTTDGKPEHATERTEYERDGFGRVTKETRWLANVAPHAGASTGFSFVTTSDYDEAGRLVTQTLPDGRRLQYRYTRADAGKTNGHRPGQLEAILFDDEVVVTDIEQTIAGGLTGYTMGNGARQQIRLDSRGRIEQLQVLGGVAGPAGWWRRIKAWFSGSKGYGDALLYRQVNRYDADGHLVQIERTLPSGSVVPQAVRRTEYAYDKMNRLRAMQTDDGLKVRYEYDKGGNRLLKTAGPIQAAPAGSTSDQWTVSYRYAPGSNRLIALITGASSGPSKPRAAWLYHATGVPLVQLTWDNQVHRASRRIVYNSAARPTAVYDNEQLVARYSYNVASERVARTTYPAARRSEVGTTTYYVYQSGRLTAEADQTGRITAHYVYLVGKPVAKIEMVAEVSPLRHLATLFRAALPTSGRIYPILTDQVGAPHTVLDPDGNLEWCAETTPYGQARVLYAARHDGHAFEMRLRLPGQLYDPETGLAQNYRREYDPALGRYTTPDPLGLAGGINPYVYADNNPLERGDPFGLYDIDIHYYMTFALARFAGMSEPAAYRLALAPQYIDDNPYTTPIAQSFGDVLSQVDRLKKYHFTQAGYDRAQMPGEGLYAYEQNRVNSPWNPQLQLLLNAANSSGNRSCTKIELVGNLLHAYEDTFGHRDQLDDPINVNGGLGHLVYGHEADKTYNEAGVVETNPAYYLASGDWVYRESRTLEMEKEVFGMIQMEFNLTAQNATGKVITFDSIAPLLAQFNHIHENEAENPNFSQKLQLLNWLLAKNGMGALPGYSVLDACRFRQGALQGVNATVNSGTILDTPAACRSDRP